MTSTNPLSADFQDEIFGDGEARANLILNYIMGRMIDGGRVSGDVKVDDPAMRAAFYTHLGNQGALEPLAIASPQIYRQMTNQFARDAAQSMGLNNG